MIDENRFITISPSLVVRAFYNNDHRQMLKIIQKANELGIMRDFLSKIQWGRSHYQYVLRCSVHQKCLATLHRLDDDSLAFLKNGRWYMTADELILATSSECQRGGCTIHCMDLSPYGSQILTSPVMMASMTWKNALSVFPTLMEGSSLTVEFVETWIWAWVLSKIK